MAGLRDVVALLNAAGVEYAKEGTQLRLTMCPLCGDDNNHFYIHESKGLWDCKKCGESGNLYELAKEFGLAEDITPVAEEVNLPSVVVTASEAEVMTAHSSLLKRPQVMKYLTEERGLKVSTIKRFRLGFSSNDTADYLVIPHYKNSNCVTLKYRTLPPAEKTFFRSPGSESILFNIDNVDLAQPVILAEGELDAITLYQYGFKNVLGVTCGAKSFLPEWIKVLSQTPIIYFCYDSDAAGQDGAYNAAHKIGAKRCRNIILPVKDANDFFKDHTAEEFQEIFDHAPKVTIKGVSRAADVIGEMLSGKTEIKLPSISYPWEKMDQYSGGMIFGGVTVLTAIPKTGKTTFALNTALSAASRGIPSLMYCLEMPAPALVMRSVSMIREIRTADVERDDLVLAMASMRNTPLYFGGSWRSLEAGLILDTLKRAIDIYDLKLIIFDNIHILCREQENLTKALGFLMRQFKALAEENNIHIMIIAQPRKIQDGNVISLNDIRDSSAIPADADTIVAMHRDTLRTSFEENSTEGVLSPITKFRIRSRYAAEGDVVLNFDTERGSFTDPELV